MIVSVCVMAYNHARYISQCLDSVLMQETNFTYEILVGEDDSSDGTRDICKKYAEEHPDKIRLFLNDRKNVIYVNGRPTGRWNFANLLKNAKGKYIALLEGDDYWTDPLKLQKQVDLLESNPKIAGCFSNAIIVDDKGQTVSDDYFTYFNKKVKPEIRTEDIIPFGTSPANTLIFRREILANPPDWFTRNIRHSGIDLLITLHGILFCIDEKLGAYRIHAGGLWSLSPLSYRLMRDLQFLKLVYRDKYMNKNYGPVIREAIRNYIVALWKNKSADKENSLFKQVISFLFAYPKMLSYFFLVPYWIGYPLLYEKLEKTTFLIRFARFIKTWTQKRS